MNIIFLLERFGRMSLMFYSLSRFLFISLFKGILYEKEADGFKLIKKKNKLNIVDIGANDGLSSSFFLNNFNNSKIIIFEPLKNSLVNLKEINNNKIKIYEVALGDKNEKKFLNTPYYFFFGTSLKIYLSAYSTISNINKKIYNLNNELKSFYFYKKILKERNKVSIMKLDNYYLKPDIIKLDIEGYEDRVIVGAKKIIKKNKPIMYIERPTLYSIKFLRSIGYKMYVYDMYKKEMINVKKISSEFRNYFFLTNIKKIKNK